MKFNFDEHAFDKFGVLRKFVKVDNQNKKSKIKK